MMEKTYFFLAGLPRTGSTLLGAILNQNPQIYVSSTSPLLDLVVGIDHVFKISNQYNINPKEHFKSKLIDTFHEKWYDDIDYPFIIDKSRGWTHHMSFAKHISNNLKIICPVRDILEILSSFILINNEGKSIFDKELIKKNISLTNDNRCDLLMKKGNGIVEQSLYGIAQCFLNGDDKYLHFVEYNDLVSDTKSTIDKIYDFLEIDKYDHDFENIVNKIEENDNLLGIPNLHEVRKTISKKKNNPFEILSTKMIEKYSNLEFWR